MRSFTRKRPKRQDDNFTGLSTGGPSFSGGGLFNPYTGLGTFGRDKVLAGSWGDPIRIPDPELQAMYHSNDLAARIVELRPYEMFRRGYRLVLPDSDGPDQEDNAELADACEEYAAKLSLNEKVREGFVWGRLFGGALLIIGADDGQDPALPLNEDAIRSVRFLNLIDRRFLFAHSYYGDPFDPKFGEVETYLITNTFGEQRNSVVHESRVLRFDGAPVDILKKRMLAGWTLSVLQRPYDTLRQFDSSFQAMSNLMIDASQGVFGIKGLMDMITRNPQILKDRMAFTDYMRSSARSIMVDADTETFERVATSFAGLPDMLDRFMQRLASAAEMPVSILFGRSVAGLNATGEADFRHFYDTVASEQVRTLEPMLRKLYRMILAADDGPGEGVPDQIIFDFAPLWMPTDAEQAEIHQKQAQADGVYLQAGFPAEQLFLSRFRGGEYSLDTEIDVDSMKQILEAKMDLAVQTHDQNAKLGPPQPQEQAGEPPNPGVPPVPSGEQSAIAGSPVARKTR